jgi:hypothetical protein
VVFHYLQPKSTSFCVLTFFKLAGQWKLPKNNAIILSMIRGVPSTSNSANSKEVVGKPIGPNSLLTLRVKNSNSPRLLAISPFLDCANDFPIFRGTNELNWSGEAERLYRLPRVKPPYSASPSKLALVKHNYSYPCALFNTRIRTKNIFGDSERFYGVDLPGFARKNKKEIERRANNLPHTIPTQERYRRALTRSANRLYNAHRDYPLQKAVIEKFRELVPYDSTEGRFLVRNQGLKYALRMYFNNLKNYQPDIYSLCHKAALELVKGDSGNRAKGICSIAVHQSESNLPKLLQQLSMQDFDKQTAPIFLFVNGNDSSKIEARLAEIEEFKTQFDSKLDIRVIAGEIDTWRYGLKSIPYITGLMTVAMRETNDDSDLASIFLDADILRFANNRHIRHYVDAISDGWVRAISGFENDLEFMKNQNYNYYLLYLMSEVSSVVGHRALKEAFRIDDYDFQTEGVHCSGGDSGFSTIVNLLAGATTAHVNHEDHDWSTRATSQLAQAYSTELDTERKFYNATTIPNSSGCGIVHDGGHIMRVANTGRSVLDVWDSHDEIEGDLDPISNNSGSINHLRFFQEISWLYQRILENTHAHLIDENSDEVSHLQVRQFFFAVAQIIFLEKALYQVFRDTYPQILENDFVFAENTSNREFSIFFSNKNMPNTIVEITKSDIKEVDTMPSTDNDLGYDIIHENSK